MSFFAQTLSVEFLKVDEICQTLERVMSHFNRFSALMLSYVFCWTHFRPVLHFIEEPVICFTEQNN